MDLNTLIATTKVEPRPYQYRIITKAVDLFCRQNMRSILIESPTGSGKTVLGLLVARAIQEQLGIRTGWVAMRRNLLAQAAVENSERKINADCEFISMFEKNPPTGMELLVVDEAQHDAANSMAHIHNLIKPRFILGLSATPFRTDRVKLCFDSVIRDAGIQPLIQDGYLSSYHYFTIPRYSPKDVAGFYCREQKRWGKTVMYFHTLDQCHEAQALLEVEGVRSAVVTGSSDREGQLELFRSGELDVLINCFVLAEGFDCPELQTVFCRPSCKGITIQMCGRAFRKHPNVPFKQIVQCQQTRWPIVRTASAVQAHTWTEEGWRSLTVNPHIEQVQGRMLQALAKIDVQLPKYLVVRQERSRRRNTWRQQRQETL